MRLQKVQAHSDKYSNKINFMKKHIYFSLIAFSIFCISADAHNKNSKKDTVKSSVCLEVIGIALDENDLPINGVEVKLFKENEELEWTEITNVLYHEHSFLFNLDANEYYTIEISKPGYVSRSVGISTKLPSTVSFAPIFHYEFEVSLFKEQKINDDFYLDFPVALISYDPKRDVFDNSILYTNHIKTKIRETANIITSTSK
jgi:hypothetical protein